MKFKIGDRVKTSIGNGNWRFGVDVKPKPIKDFIRKLLENK